MLTNFLGQFKGKFVSPLTFSFMQNIMIVSITSSKLQSNRNQFINVENCFAHFAIASENTKYYWWISIGFLVKIMESNEWLWDFANHPQNTPKMVSCYRNNEDIFEEESLWHAEAIIYQHICKMPLDLLVIWIAIVIIGIATEMHMHWKIRNIQAKFF